ncbi:MAG TPA: hypothetical protein PLX59_00265 [Candidatus Cloacimonadota bacterium]|nr:hypothetical protein [Candidatus Cloacimonadota bacterium]
MGLVHNNSTQLVATSRQVNDPNSAPSLPLFFLNRCCRTAAAIPPRLRQDCGISAAASWHKCMRKKIEP